MYICKKPVTNKKKKKKIVTCILILPLSIFAVIVFSLCDDHVQVEMEVKITGTRVDWLPSY